MSCLHFYKANKKASISFSYAESKRALPFKPWLKYATGGWFCINLFPVPFQMIAFNDDESLIKIWHLKYWRDSRIFSSISKESRALSHHWTDPIFNVAFNLVAIPHIP